MLALLYAVALAAGPPPPATIGAADRKSILQALRAPVERQLGKPVEFVVSELRGKPGWAFIQAEPQRPGGRAIEGRAYFPRDWDDMDGLTTTAILRKRAGRWRVEAMRIGALDAWYCGYLPAGQYDPCEP
jgi:hypothetical protein